MDPEDESVLPREHLVLRVLQLSQVNELVLLKGPAGVGKSSLMNLADYYCQTHEVYGDVGVPTPVTGYTFMERDKPEMEQLREAVSKMEQLTEKHPSRLLFCDDIQNVPSSFWEKLVNNPFLKENKLRIVGATTRRCASDPASPVITSDALISFSDLRLDPKEEEQFLSLLLPDNGNFQTLDKASEEMVVAAVRDQCEGHIFALQASLRKLDSYAALPQNRNAKAMTSYLLSKEFLDHTYERIWPPNTDDFSEEQRRELEDAMMDTTKTIGADLLFLLLKVYFIQDANQKLEPMTWLQIKQSTSFKLSTRRLYSSLFQDRAPETTKYNNIQELVLKVLSTLRRVDLSQSCKASESMFPKEGPLQQMFFKGLTSCLPASTEVVSEMSAILPDRGDKKRGELDFYVNRGYHYGIELMRDGSSFKEHLDRFSPPVSGNDNRGKYFTPAISEFLIVDFRKSGFRPRNKEAFRLVVVFHNSLNGCDVLSEGKVVKKITFGTDKTED